MNRQTKQIAKPLYKSLTIFGIGVIWIILLQIVLPFFNLSPGENLLIELLLSFAIMVIISAFIFIFIKKASDNENSLEKLYTEDESWYRVLFENANDSITIIKQNIVIDCNNKTEEIFKAKKDEIIGKSLLELSPEFQAEGLTTDEALRNIIKDIYDGKVRSFHWRHKRLDNVEFDAEISTNTITIGGVSFLISIIRDITKTKEAERALIESEAKYRFIEENINDLIWKMDTNFRYTYISPLIYKLRGYTVEEAMNMPVLDLLSNHSSKDIQNKLKTKISQIEDNNPEGYEPVIFDAEFYHKNGKSLFMEINARVVKNNNKYEVLGVTRDITEKKKAELELKEQEERYKRLSDVTFEGILIHNNGIIEDINKSFTNILGYQKDEVVGKNILSFLISESTKHLVEKNIKITKDVFYEVEFITKAGKQIPVEIEAHNYMEKGRQMRVVAFRDISERKRLQQKILQTIINTEEQERSRVAKEMHDGLGPLLSASKIYLNVLAQSDDAERKSTALLHLASTIEEAIYSVQEISNNLSPHILQNFGLAEALKSFCHKLSMMTQTNINVQSNLDIRVNREVETTTYRVIVELVNNTLKYADASKIDINIDYDAPLLRVNYRDNGKGFDVDKVMSKLPGMGMFNIFKRVESLDGRIDIKSEPGKGINVKILLVAL